MSCMSLALYLPQPLALELQLPLLILLGYTCKSGWKVTPGVEDVYRAWEFSWVVLRDRRATPGRQWAVGAGTAPCLASSPRAVGAHRRVEGAGSDVQSTTTTPLWFYLAETSPGMTAGKRGDWIPSPPDLHFHTKLFSLQEPCSHALLLIIRIFLSSVNHIHYSAPFMKTRTMTKPS